MAKKRVYELAKDLGIDSRDMIAKLQTWGLDNIRAASQTLEDDQVRTVMARIADERRPSQPARPAAGGVVIRRSRAMGQTLGEVSSPAPSLEPVAEAAPAAVESVPVAPVTVEAPSVEAVVGSEPVAAAVEESPTEAPTPVPTEAEAPAVAASAAPVVTEPAPAPVAAPATSATPAAPAIQRPSANRAVLVARSAPGFTPPIRRPAPGAAPTAAPAARPVPGAKPAAATVLPASAMRPGVSGTAANVRSAPIASRPAPAGASVAVATASGAPVAAAATPAPAPVPVPAGTSSSDLKPGEEIRIINGVPHVVQKAPPTGGQRPTATQAVLVSRPVFITKRVTPTQQPKQAFPEAPGIKAGALVRESLAETRFVDTSRTTEADGKGRGGKRPSGVRNEKVENYSKQDLLDLVRQRTVVPVIGRKKRPLRRGKKTEITEMKASKKVIGIEETITVRELSERMGVKGTDLVRKLMQGGGGGGGGASRVVNLNQSVDYETATIIAADYGWEVVHKSYEVSDFVPEVPDKPEDMKARPPVVTVMGHVDHGKTSLLDALRKANVAEGESGGITQHIGAYSVTLPGKGDITFLDTPGHEAFSAMRSRGAQATDIVILVVAADDGVQPQTIESIKHAKEADVAIVVAINKIDKPGVNPDKIKSDLAAHGLTPEDWGGTTPMIPVSARQRINLDLLLENVLLQAEIMELAANPKKAAVGVVIESKVERGRGPVATVLVQEGTLKQGDSIVCGPFSGKVRSMTDEKGRALKQVDPGYPVQVVGLSGAPDAGEDMHAVPSEDIAKKIADYRQKKLREAELAKSARMTVEDLVRKSAADAPKELVVIVKADVQGSAEAITEALRKIPSKKVSVNVISRGVGVISEGDVSQANASKALVVGFKVKPDSNAQVAASQTGVKVKTYDIIYSLLDDVRVEMEDLLEPIYRERALGKAEVLQVFSVSKVGQIGGSKITEGKVVRNAQVRVLRDRKVVHSGKVGSLKRFKDDVREVVSGNECGIGVDGFNELQTGDVLEVFDIETIRQKLE